MPARPEGRAGKPGLERHFFADALRYARFVGLRREQHDLAVEVERQRPDLESRLLVALRGARAHARHGIGFQVLALLVELAAGVESASRLVLTEFGSGKLRSAQILSEPAPLSVSGKGDMSMSLSSLTRAPCSASAHET